MRHPGRLQAIRATELELATLQFKGYLTRLCPACAPRADLPPGLPRGLPGGRQQSECMHQTGNRQATRTGQTPLSGGGTLHLHAGAAELRSAQRQHGLPAAAHLPQLYVPVAMQRAPRTAVHRQKPLTTRPTLRRIELTSQSGTLPELAFARLHDARRQTELGALRRRGQRRAQALRRPARSAYLCGADFQSLCPGHHTTDSEPQAQRHRPADGYRQSSAAPVHHSLKPGKHP